MKARQVTVEEAEMLQQLGVRVYCSDLPFEKLGRESKTSLDIDGRYWGITPEAIPFHEWITRVVLEE